MKLAVNGKGTRMSNAVKRLSEKGLAFMNKHNAVRLAKLSLVPALAMLMFTGVVRADDLAAPGQTTVNDTFGAESSLAGWVIIGEILVGVVTYIKTRNIFALGSVAIVMVFLNVAYSLIT
ncbi:type IV conjugative transfer system pilin TraA [Nissabacter archeti]|uniref:type IV conjugative transfer system pilin TraA n=1 Tax=Nissabacter archeti TaxID=1917880 RepID=UPI001C3191AB|nr:type IV conjugative transfer system pilin TraA [Nissabacter archeti]